MALNSDLRKMVSSVKSKYSGGVGKTVKPKEGRNTYRIIAPSSDQAAWVVNGQFWADLGIHWIKADPNGKPLVVLGDCDTVYQQPSVVNTAIEMAINNAVDEDSKKLFEEWKARKSVIFNVIDRSTGTEEILELTPTTFGKVLDLYTLYDDAGQDITHPLTGSDIIITRTGKGLNTNYDVAIAPAIPGKPFDPVTKVQMEKAKDLPEFIAQNFFRGEEQKALNAIASIAGIAVPRLSGPSSASAPASIAGPSTAARTPTAALTSPAASAVEAAPVAAAPVVDSVAEAAAIRRQEILKRQAEAAAELEALEAPAPAAVEAAPSPATLASADQDAILAELENLT